MSKGAARGRAWLLAGAALGVGLAVRGVVRAGGDTPRLPADAVAVVGNSVISRQVLDDAVAADTEGQPQRGADPEVRRRVLERLIDEGLLVQGALAIGLPTRDAKVREDLASAMRENVTGEAVSQPPDDVLRAYEQDHPAPYVREGGQLAPLDDVRTAVFAAWRQDDDARRLRRWLDQRRKETRIVVGEGLP